MFVVMEKDHTAKQLEAVMEQIKTMGFKAHIIHGITNDAIGVTGNTTPLDPSIFEVMPGVKEALPVTKPYKLASREFKHGNTVIHLKPSNVTIGGDNFVIIAGPCAVESREQTLRIAKLVKHAGAHILRGGAFKPRTSPYSFQGLGIAGLEILAAAREETGLPIVTEAMDQESLDAVYKYTDIVQIGARNMQNFSLLRAVGRLDKPVLLKRGMSATIEEWLMSAEYIMSEGNKQIVLCERGIRTFSDHSRNTLDLNAVPVIQKLSHLPVLVDPSHATGLRDKVAPMSLAAAAVRAHGLMIEVHDKPEEALCDGAQALHPEQLKELIGQLRGMGKVLGFKL